MTKCKVKMADVLQSKRISSLPENILLMIFAQLPVKDLCTIGRVCRAWRRVINDNSLWRHVDLTPYKINIQRMWKVIRAHFSGALLSLRMRGYMDPAGANWQKHSLSEAMLKELRERCPNMQELSLTMTNVSCIQVENLPPKLRHLSITSSFIPVGWFKGASELAVLKELHVLDLSYSTKTTNADIKDLCGKNSMTTMKLNGCYRISEEGIKTISDCLKQLEVLEISETGCTDLCLHHIGRHLTKLKRLDLSKCTKITDVGLGSLAAGIKQLEWLSLARCSDITDIGVDHLRDLKRLQYVNLQGTKVENTERTCL